MRVHALGLEAQMLADAIKYGWTHRQRSRKPYEPRGAAGFYMWAKTTGSLREQLAAKGWKLKEEMNLPVIVHPNGKVAIAVSHGDSNTGIPNKTPSTYREKGKATVQVVATNQLSFNGPAFDRNDQFQTYMLLYFHDARKQEIRLELALPAAMTGAFVVEWRERIILSPVSTKSQGVPKKDAVPIKVNVKKSAAG